MADFKNRRVVYYRLKQINLDGKYEYSAIRRVLYNSNPKTFLQVSPNPFMEKLTVNFISKDNGRGEVRMINDKGQIVLAKQSKF